MEKYLDKCLSSLVLDNQILMNQLEVIIVIDGANDRSSEIAHKYQERYPESIIVIDKENGNYGSCVNRGIHESSGKYFKVLDADDWFVSQNLSSYVGNLNEIDADLVLTDFADVTEEGEILKIKKYSDQGLEPHSVITIDKLMQMQPVFYGQMHGFTYRTDLLKGMKYHQLEGVSYTDSEYVIVPFTQVDTVFYVPVVLYQYLRGREGQTMTTIMNKSVNQLMSVLLDVFEYLERIQYDKKLYEVYLENQLSIILLQVYYSGIYLQSYENDLLREFDEQFVKFPKFYNLCNRFTLWKIKYVKLWRIQRRITFFQNVFLKFVKIIG